MLTYNLDDVDDEEVQRAELTAWSGRVSRPFVRKLWALLALGAVFGGVLLIRSWRADSRSDSTKPVSAAGQAQMPTSSAIEEMFGVRFIGVDVTSGGGMIQLRYQILDVDKTQAVHDEDSAPYVIDSSGAKYADPGMVGHSHVDKHKLAGATDYILIANAKGGVKAGSIVTIKIGDLELRGVPVD